MNIVFPAEPYIGDPMCERLRQILSHEYKNPNSTHEGR